MLKNVFILVLHIHILCYTYFKPFYSVVPLYYVNLAKPRTIFSRISFSAWFWAKIGQMRNLHVTWVVDVEPQH